jgi:Protein of unknown function (DUF3500)
MSTLLSTTSMAYMKKTIALLFCLFSLVNFVIAQSIVKATQDFIALLGDGQKNNTLFAFDDPERFNFHFVPMDRKGITFNEMNPAQQAAALKMLSLCASEKAYQLSQEIMQLEIVLKALEKRSESDRYRDPGNYHISIFGVPTNHSIWGWRFEGHHQSFNFSFNEAQKGVGAPIFLGSNPAIVLEGPAKGKQLLKAETDGGFRLLHALDQAQLKKAVIDSIAFKDILSFDKRSALIGNPVGIRYSDLTATQQQLLLELLQVYINRNTKLFAKDQMDQIKKDNLNLLYFAWAGATREALGKGTYYRIQGPGILIEYDNTQNKANHVHSVLRDLKNDFGGDLLLEHYQKSHK